MNNSSNKKSHKRILIVLLLVAITAGAIFMFRLLGKSQEEHRNREYEVSCVVELFFNERSIKYKINYSKNDKHISDVSLEIENRKEDREFLNSHLGKTSKLTKIIYSDGSEGEY